MKTYFSSTLFKIQLARLLAAPVIKFHSLFKLSFIKTVKRKGMNWELDLAEAIDFCIWLTGGYEPDLSSAFKEKIATGDIVFDIGANIGAHTLDLAQLVGENGHVHAFEATRWGVEKLKKNLSLNPELKNRVSVHHVYLVAPGEESVDKVSASWRIDKAIDDSQRNILDQGFAKSTIGSLKMTLDEWCNLHKIPTINAIKLDVDGNEVSILRGSKEILHKFSPLLFMELSPIHYLNHRHKFIEQIKIVNELGFELKNLKGNKLSKNVSDVEKSIPFGALVNVIGTKK